MKPDAKHCCAGGAMERHPSQDCDLGVARVRLRLVCDRRRRRHPDASAGRARGRRVRAMPAVTIETALRPRAGELVLIQSETATANRPELPGRGRGRRGPPSGSPLHAELRQPLRRRQRGTDCHRRPLRLAPFRDRRRRRPRRRTASAQPSTPSTRRRRPTPTSSSPSPGDASINSQLEDSISDDFE